VIQAQPLTIGDPVIIARVCAGETGLRLLGKRGVIIHIERGIADIHMRTGPAGMLRLPLRDLVKEWRG